MDPTDVAVVYMPSPLLARKVKLLLQFTIGIVSQGPVDMQRLLSNYKLANDGLELVSYKYDENSYKNFMQKQILEGQLA